jgi:hypothetical protein
MGVGIGLDDGGLGLARVGIGVADVLTHTDRLARATPLNRATHTSNVVWTRAALGGILPALALGIERRTEPGHSYRVASRTVVGRGVRDPQFGAPPPCPEHGRRVLIHSVRR